MSDEQERLEEESRRAQYAEQVINNPIYKEAMLILRADLMDGFEKTGFKQKDERDEIWRMLKTVNKFEEQLNFIMQTGELAKRSLKDLLKLRG